MTALSFVRMTVIRSFSIGNRFRRAVSGTALVGFALVALASTTFRPAHAEETVQPLEIGTALPAFELVNLRR